MKLIDNSSRLLQKILTVIAGTVLMAMIALTCANIVLRQASVPIRGVVELMGLGGSLVIGLSLAYTQQMRENIAVDILVTHFPKLVQRILTCINYFICGSFSVIACQQLTKLGLSQMNSGELTETLRIIYYPFTFGVALGFALLSLVFLMNLIEAALPAQEQQ